MQRVYWFSERVQLNDIWQEDVCEEEDNTSCFFSFFSKKMGRVNCL